MGNRNHRPFEGLTWPQLTLIRDVAQGTPLDWLGEQVRAAVGLEGRRVKLVDLDRRPHLTPEGKRVWERMCAWRPDLYRD